MLRIKALLLGLAALAVEAVCPVVALAAQVLIFPVQTVQLSDSYLGAPVDTLSRTLTGHVANFTLSGRDHATFSVGFGFTPDDSDIHPYSLSVSLLSASWSTEEFPYLTLWTEAGSGGFTVGDQVGDHGHNLFNLFKAADSRGQVYGFGTLAVPEPATWSLILVGFGVIGANLRTAKRRAQAA